MIGVTSPLDPAVVPLLALAAVLLLKEGWWLDVPADGTDAMPPVRLRSATDAAKLRYC